MARDFYQNYRKLAKAPQSKRKAEMIKDKYVLRELQQAELKASWMAEQEKLFRNLQEELKGLPKTLQTEVWTGDTHHQQPEALHVHERVEPKAAEPVHVQEKMEPHFESVQEELMVMPVEEPAYVMTETEIYEERPEAVPVNHASGSKNIKVSVIIPSYNKYEYVSLSLHCLTRQTFDPAQFEVILIDDCSTDETPRLKNEFVSEFTFKYIRPQANLGRSRARNLGIENSEGEVLIFMDAEMLTERNFIEEHYKHHIHESNVVVTGAMHYRGVYTFLSPLFNESQWSHIDGFLPRSAYFAGRYYDYKATHRNELTYFPLAGKEDINAGRIHDISFPNWYLTSILNSGLSHFGENLSGFALPYIAFLTGDVSVKKAMLNQTGYFDESFQGYGAEDWELGYRLFKNGAKFRVDPAAFCYHQEHPTSSGNFREAMGNLYKFMNKSPEIEVLALALEQRPGLNFLEIHYVVSQYREMEARFPNQFSAFKTAFISMMYKVVELLRDGQTVTRLVKDINFPENEILDQLSEIRDHRWHMLADAFERLAKL